MLLTVIWFILIGAVVGLLARLVVPGRNSIGTLMTILVGIVGAILGGVVAHAVGAGTLIAFIFAVVIAAILAAMIGGGARRRHGAFCRSRAPAPASAAGAGGAAGRPRWGGRFSRDQLIGGPYGPRAS